MAWHQNEPNIDMAYTDPKSLTILFQWELRLINRGMMSFDDKLALSKYVNLATSNDDLSSLISL